MNHLISKRPFGQPVQTEEFAFVSNRRRLVPQFGLKWHLTRYTGNPPGWTVHPRSPAILAPPSRPLFANIVDVHAGAHVLLPVVSCSARCSSIPSTGCCLAGAPVSGPQQVSPICFYPSFFPLARLSCSRWGAVSGLRIVGEPVGWLPTILCSENHQSIALIRALTRLLLLCIHRRPPIRYPQ